MNKIIILCLVTLIIGSQAGIIITPIGWTDPTTTTTNTTTTNTTTTSTNTTSTNTNATSTPTNTTTTNTTTTPTNTTTTSTNTTTNTTPNTTTTTTPTSTTPANTSTSNTSNTTNSSNTVPTLTPVPSNSTTPANTTTSHVISTIQNSGPTTVTISIVISNGSATPIVLSSQLPKPVLSSQKHDSSRQKEDEKEYNKDSNTLPTITTNLVVNGDFQAAKLSNNLQVSSINPSIGWTLNRAYPIDGSKVAPNWKSQIVIGNLQCSSSQGNPAPNTLIYQNIKILKAGQVKLTFNYGLVSLGNKSPVPQNGEQILFLNFNGRSFPLIASDKPQTYEKVFKVLPGNAELFFSPVEDSTRCDPQLFMALDNISLFYT